MYFLKFRYLDIFKKKTLKRIALLCHAKLPEIKYNAKFGHWHCYVFDIIIIKTFRPKNFQNGFTVKFCNKVFEQSKLKRILKFKSYFTRLLEKIILQENIPVGTYRITKKKFWIIKRVYNVYDDIYFTSSNRAFDCERSTFYIEIVVISW